MKNELFHYGGEEGINEPRDNFELSREQWAEGQLSSDEFLPVAYRKLLTTAHLIENGDTPLSSVEPEKLAEVLDRSEILEESKQRGINGEPPIEITEKHLRTYFGTLGADVVERRYKEQKKGQRELNLWEFGLLDKELLTSLPLNLYVAKKDKLLYKTGNEQVYFNRYKNSIYENLGDNGDATTILLWLHYRGLRSAIKRYEISSILRITDRKDAQFVYADYNQLAISLSPYAYFCGWEMRLTELNGWREKSLSKPFKTTKSKQALLTSYFLHESTPGERFDILGSAVESISRTGKTEEIGDQFATMQADAILDGKRGPLRSWEIKNLGIRDMIDSKLAGVKDGSEDVTQVEKDTGERVVHQDVYVTSDREPEEVSEEQTKSLPIISLKDNLSSNPVWSDTDFTSYTYALLEGNEALLTSEKYPAELRINDEIYNALKLLEPRSGTRYIEPFYLGWDNVNERINVSNPADSTLESWAGMPRTELMSEILKRSDIDPAIGKIYRKNQILLPVRDDEVFLPTSELYKFIQDPHKLPINILRVNDRAYVVFRASDTKYLEERNTWSRERQFVRKWYTIAGIRVPQNILEEVTSFDNISLFSGEFNRRIATIKAADEHNVSIFESTDLIHFDRIT